MTGVNGSPLLTDKIPPSSQPPSAYSAAAGSDFGEGTSQVELIVALCVMS